MINNKRLLRLTQKLVRIDSQNPPGDEYRIGRFLQGYLKKIGLGARIYEFKKRRPNIVAVLPGKDRKHSLLITPHLDTVPCGKGWSFKPLGGVIKGDRLYGLGATDCKCNLAVGLEAINSLVEDGATLNYNLIFCATADEESGSGLGLIPLLEKGILKADEAVVLDADDFSIIIRQKGLLHLKIKIQGRRAHGAYPWQGENAIDAAVNILKALKGRKMTYRKDKFLKGPTLNIGTIRGGDKVNIVADWCEFELDFRFLPGMSEKVFLGGLKRNVARYARRFKIEISGIQQPYQIRESHRLVKCLAQAMRKAGVRPDIRGSEGATTVAFFQKKGIPAIATGFGASGCAHATDEYVRIDNLFRGARILEDFLKSYRFS